MCWLGLLYNVNYRLKMSTRTDRENTEGNYTSMEEEEQ